MNFNIYDDSAQYGSWQMRAVYRFALIQLCILIWLNLNRSAKLLGAKWTRVGPLFYRVTRKRTPRLPQEAASIPLKIFSAVAAICLLNFAAGPVEAQVPAYRFTPSGLDAGGYQNVVAVAPQNSQIVLSGADTAGINRSTDGGAYWILSNQGLETHPYLRIASIAYYSPTDVYIAVGNANGVLKNPSGGVFKSTDGGHSWKPFNLTIHIAGSTQNSPNLPSNDSTLRSTGNLLVFSGPFLYVGSYDNGVYKCVLRSGACTQIASTAGLYIRSLIIDAADPENSVFAAAINIGSSAPAGLGVYKVSDLRTEAPTATLLIAA